MKEEYIKREMVLDILSRYSGDTAIREIERLEAADVRPERHGRWSDKMVSEKENSVGYHDDDLRFGFKCSECGAILNKTKYCGNCGAKMDKKG